MEKNQQNGNKEKDTNSEASTSLKNQQPGQELPKNSETENATRFAETSDSKEQHSDRSSPSAENETLGTP